MIEINAYNSLNTAKMKSFLAESDSLVLVQIEKENDITFEDAFEKSELKSIFESGLKVDKDDVVYFISENAALVCSGKDLEYWSKLDRYLKLFDEKEKKKERVVKLEAPEYQVKIGKVDLENENIEELCSFEGSKKQALEFLNKNFSIYKIKSFFKDTLVVKINNSNWKTEEDMKKEGLIK